VGTGIFLVVLAVLLPTVVYPRLAVLPFDPRASQTVHGTDFTVFMPRSAADGGLKLYRGVDVTSRVWVTEETGSGPRPADSPNVNWRVATTTSVDGVGLLQVMVEGVSLDRRTARATNCCRDYVITQAGDTVGRPVTHSGYVFMFPFDVQKQAYPLWDVGVEGTVDAYFAGEERRRGLRVYRFVQTVSDRKIGTQELPGRVFRLSDPSVVADARYATRRTFWVEPNSGAVVDFQQTMDRRFTYQGRVLPVFQGTLKLRHGGGDDATLDLVRQAAFGLPLVKRTLPWTLGPLGADLLVGGIVLIVRRSRRSRRGGPPPGAGDGGSAVDGAGVRVPGGGGVRLAPEPGPPLPRRRPAATIAGR
jgi:hypothetical protein